MKEEEKKNDEWAYLDILIYMLLITFCTYNKCVSVCDE